MDTKAVYLISAAMLLVNCVFAAEISWIGTSGGRWNDGKNWMGGEAPGGSDTAVFALEKDTRTIFPADGAVAKIVVKGARLDLYSGTGKTLSFGGAVPELAVDAGAELRISGLSLASSAKVTKTGIGRLVVVEKAASAVDLAHAEGELQLEDVLGKDMTVVENDTYWTYDGTRGNGASIQHSPYGGTDGVYVGNDSGECVTVTARRMPININGKFRVSGDVLMEGSGSHGFAVVLHNDPRGYLARTVCQQDRWLGYAAIGDDKGAIRKSFAFGVLNHYSMGEGRVMWGWDGEWRSPSGQTGVLTDPLIYTSPCGANTQSERHPRRFKLQLDFDRVAKSAILTLVQDQREIVTGGGETVTWTKTLSGIDLTDLCEGDTATLAFTTDAGGRNTAVTISNLKVEYFKTEQHIKEVISVLSSDELWESCCFDSRGNESQGLVYGTLEGSVHAGANAGSKCSVTARKEKVGVKGKFQVSGRVTDTGTGSWGWALVLHNDARGSLAHAAQAGNNGMAYSGTDKIGKSYAFRIINYHGNKGQVSDGKNGVWNSVRTTNPLILTNPYDGTSLVAGGAKYDFSALFDEREKTMVLTLSQDQAGETKTAVETFTDVEVPVLVDGESAWLSLTSDAGGRTTSATIDNFKIEYLAYDDEAGDSSFFRSLEATGLRPVVSATSGDDDFVADMGSLTVNGGTLQLGRSAQPSVTVIKSEELWENGCFDGETQAQGVVYGEREGSIHVGVHSANRVSVTTRKEPVGVNGRFRISGKVTDVGSGALGWALVLHNDQRGNMAHAALDSGFNMAYGGVTGAIQNSYAFRICSLYANRGLVGDGRNGVWNDLRATVPRILTNPYDGTSLVAGGAKYDFSALFDAQSKTMVLTLTQDQNGERVTAVETFTAVDVPALVGGDRAWISLLATTGGRTINATIDDFKIEYMGLERDMVAFSCNGHVAVANNAELAMGNSTFMIKGPDQLLDLAAIRLYNGARLVVDDGQKAQLQMVYVDGVKVPRGIYTADDCGWVGGFGSIELRVPGLVLIFR